MGLNINSLQLTLTYLQRVCFPFKSVFVIRSYIAILTCCEEVLAQTLFQPTVCMQVLVTSMCLTVMKVLVDGGDYVSHNDN